MYRFHNLDEFQAGMLSDRVTRRTLLKRTAILGLSGPVVASLLAACSDEVSLDEEQTDDEPAVEAGEDDSAEGVSEDGSAEEADDEVDSELDDDSGADSDEEPESDEGTRGEQYGGSLAVAMAAEPPSLDLQATTHIETAFSMWHVYEPLFSYDDDFHVVPELVESHEVSDDGLVNSLILRTGVNFHNGEAMTAADVIASLERWGAIGAGSSLMGFIDDLVEIDDHTIELHMNRPYGALTAMLARQNGGLGIYPASVIEAAGESLITDAIGTGPYFVAEREIDRFIRLRRFEDYSYRDEPSTSYSGRKHQYLDEIEFIPVPDEAGRIAGIQAGEFDFLHTITPEQFEVLEDDPNVVSELLDPFQFLVFVFNWKSQLTGDVLIRRAVQAALNMDEIALAAFGEGYYRLDPSLQLNPAAWYTTAGEHLYNQADPERARELLEESGYDGTPLRFMTTQEIDPYYRAALVAEQQLTDVGINVELLIFDWATIGELREDPDEWEMFPTTTSFRSDPLQNVYTNCNWAGWACNETTEALIDDLQSQVEFEDRYATFEEFQEHLYEYVGMTKIAEEQNLTVRSPRVQGWPNNIQLQAALWNVWVED